MIEGVIVTPLRQILDERGKIMHMLRSDAPHFRSFGEIYFAWIYPGVVKGWHLHTKMTLNYAVPVGRVKLVMYDGRDGSPSRGKLWEMFLGPDHYALVTIPPGVWNGTKGCGTEPAMIANCASIPHDEGEMKRLDPFDPSIPYDWALKHR